MNSAGADRPIPSNGPPWIGPAEQQIFAIENTRERADRLKEVLTPKLEALLDEACDLLNNVYGADILSPCRLVATPAHRPGAKKTQSFRLASAGLAVKGQHWYFQHRIECNSRYLNVKFFGLRGLEGNPIVQVMQNHLEGSIRLLRHVGCSVFQSTKSDELDLAGFIRSLRLIPELQKWHGTYIIGSFIDLPIEEPDAAWPVVYDFVALFPIFRAAADVLRGEVDGFETYAERFWNWPDRDEEQEDAEPVLEGGYKLALRRHHQREKRLRKQKIEETIQLENGRLRCEVPGCGFDFYEVYGELGRNFAHVHHKRPLSDRTGPELTKLSDLAIVCANCHAMIHRGRECRDLEDLIPKYRESTQ